MMTNKLDLELLSKLSIGNHEAFRDLFVAYYPKVKSFINHLIKNEAVSQELSQDIFVKIWENRLHLTQIRSLNAYIYRMARNTAINHLNRKFLENDYLSNYETLNDSFSIEEEFHAKETDLLIKLIVSKMPPQRQKVYILSRIQFLKNEEIADMLHISKKTVENHLNLALNEIRKVIFLYFIFFN